LSKVSLKFSNVHLSGGGWALCAVGVKLNVLQKRWLVFRLAALLILRSVGIFSFFCLSVYGRVWFFTMTPNGFGLGEGGDFHHKC
jgi:hypothetical protein